MTIDQQIKKLLVHLVTKDVSIESIRSCLLTKQDRRLQLKDLLILDYKCSDNLPPPALHESWVVAGYDYDIAQEAEESIFKPYS